MNNFNYVKPCLLLLTINITCLPLLPNLNSKAETKKTNPTLSWVNIFLPLSKPKPPVKPRKAVGRDPGSSTPNSVCMISPDAPMDKTRVVWNNRPLFLWQGNPLEVGLNKDRKTKLWTQKIAPGQQFINYTGESLQPGLKYFWVVWNKDSTTGEMQVTANIPFQVMETQQRDRITNELKSLENQYKGANGEAIALTKADYFIQQELWADALQQAYSVEKPSAELLKTRKAILQQMKTECDK
ncbi:hypothetical protein H6G81_09795 [Scytonema hofmannii FACHB-248]|uniref:DUF928 domain-containing protein n=1 Tax=Scytonema hofmannii FACHB-248 TaxID=1842502 RepID=A0ABR8GP45_9CYAN|nr:MULTISPECIES: hypothetical protein [Nostocales]MBD2604809.1 hypothetical protein [Scytonema hofmannii FACHB-248]